MLISTVQQSDSVKSIYTFFLKYSFPLWVIIGYWVQFSVLCSVCSVTQCDSMDCSPPGSSVHGIPQARIQEWVAISSPRGSSQSRIKPAAPALAGGFFTTEWPGVNQKLLLWKLSWAMEKILFTKARPVISMGINSCCIWVVRDYCFPGLWWDPDAHEKVWNEVSERRLRS